MNLGQDCNRKDQLDENNGLTGLTMMVGQTRLNVEPAPVDCCDEVRQCFNYIVEHKICKGTKINEK